MRYSVGESRILTFHARRGTHMAIHSFNQTAKGIVLTLQDYSLFAYRAFMNLFRPPIYWTDFLVQSDIIGFGSLSIVVLSGLSTGGVLALQSAATLANFGATAVTGQFVSLTMIRELGPVLTGVMVSGRNASSMASELGSMVVTEQIDAMRALGVDPLRKLVTPRIFASIAMLFFLTIVADAFGILGGGLVTVHAPRGDTIKQDDYACAQNCTLIEGNNATVNKEIGSSNKITAETSDAGTPPPPAPAAEEISESKD